MSVWSKFAKQSLQLNKQFTRMSSSKITPIICADAPPAAGPYSHAIINNGLVYVSGQIPYTKEFKPVTGDIQAQTEQCFQNLKAILKDSDSSLERVLKVNIFITDMGNFGKINEVYGKYFDQHKPARSCVAVKTLPLNVDIEMECIASQN